MRLNKPVPASSAAIPFSSPPVRQKTPAPSSQPKAQRAGAERPAVTLGHDNIPGNLTVGVLSDTHGLLRPEILSALAGVDHILHAGDVGKPEILDALRAIAPLTAIRGNIDRSGPCSALPATEAVELSGHLFYLVHALPDLKLDLDLNPKAAGISAVIYGHSHKPSVTWNDGILYLNPGSAGPRRFSLPITLALLRLEDRTLRPELITLDPS